MDGRMRERQPVVGGESPKGSGGESLAVRLYSFALRILPPRIRASDSREMVMAFSDLWEEELGNVARLRLTLRSFGRLPKVALLDWIDHITGAPGPGRGKRPWRWGMSAWMRNLRYALRTLRKTPAFALTTVILIGLGVGSVTTIFTLVDHVLLRPLQYPSAERLFLVENGSHSGPMVREMQKMRSVEKWGIVLSETANLVGEGDPVRIQQTEISRDFFSLFGARPQAGRLFVEEDFTATNVAVLSYGLWQRVFGSDEGVVGRVVRVNDAPFTVVGVLSEEFLAPEAVFHGDSGADIWLPLDWGRPALEEVGYHNLQVAGLVSPTATLADVDDEIQRALVRMADRYPEQFRRDDGTLAYDIPPAGLQEITTRPVRAGLNLLLGAVGLLLLVACMNVAHLFLARGLGRVQEMAVRRALGADTPSLVQQLLVESLVLGTVGGALGLGLASLGLGSFMALNPSFIPRSENLALDLRILLFAGLISVATVLLFGLLPALRSVGKDLTADLKGGSRSATTGRRASKLRSGLVVAEVAFSLILVAGAALLLKSFMRVQARDPGFDVARVWTLPLTPSWIQSPEEYLEAMDRVEASLAEVPGVIEATYSLTLPFEFTGRGRCCWITRTLSAGGEEHEGLRLLLQPATESYFSTLGIPLLAGRAWSESEARIEPWPVVIAEVLAVEVFGSADAAINQTMDVGRDGTQVRVMGVAADTRHFGLDQDPALFIYLPMEQLPFDIAMAHMAVKLRGDPPENLARTLREAVWDATPDMPVPTVRSMTEWVSESTAGRRFDSVLFGAFGIMALILAAAGLYGTLLYSVGQQRRELGIRLALGAGRGSVERRVVAKGLILAALGSVVGLGGAWATGRFLASRLYNLAPNDPATLFTAVAVLLVVAGVSSWLPARRAGRTDPLETLKAE
jgi:putative ABC transport system permease protein